MGKFLKTVFGKNGIVSNAVDLASVPNQIKETKSEITSIEDELKTIESRYISLLDEGVKLTSTTQDISLKEANLLTLETELKALFLEESRDTKTIAVKSVEFHSLSEEINVLKEKHQMCAEHHTLIVEQYQTEKSATENRLNEARVKLAELEEKLSRKKGQMDGNLKIFGRK